MLPFVMPAFVAAQQEAAAAESGDAWYRFNRITEEYRIQEDGTVEVTELMTMLYNGPFRSMWRALPKDELTAVLDISIYDASTGEEFVRSSDKLDVDDPASWGKYHVSEDDTATNIEWYYQTGDRVHTWRLRYTLHGAVGYYADRDELSRDFFSDFDVPVDTVEATVLLPERITEPSARIFTTGGHDFYIDRPDDRTYRFRVSDIAPGERVGVTVSWQKGLVRPPLSWAAFLLWFKLPTVQLIGAIGLVVVVSAAIIHILRRPRMLRYAQYHASGRDVRVARWTRESSAALFRYLCDRGTELLRLLRKIGR